MAKRDPNIGYDDHALWDKPWDSPYGSAYGKPIGPTGETVQPGIRINPNVQRLWLDGALPKPNTDGPGRGPIRPDEIARGNFEGAPTPNVKKTGGGGAATPGLNKAAQTSLKFAASSVPGIYMATAPDGSVTYTNQPGGTFVPGGTDATPAPSRANRLVNNALYGPGVQTRVGAFGTGTGNFSAAEATSPAKFRYILPSGGGAVDAGTKAGLAPGTTAWINKNNEAINPLESQDAANQYAVNQRAVNDLRRGDGRFNTTIDDPSGYLSGQAPSAMGGFGLGGFGGMNPLDAAEKLANINAKQTEAAASSQRAQAAADKENEANLQNIIDLPDTKKEAAAYGLDPRTYATLIQFADKHAADDPLALGTQGAKFRKILAQLSTNTVNSGRGILDWMSEAGPEALPGGDASEGQLEAGKHGELPLLAFKPTVRWNTNAVQLPPQIKGARIPFDDPRAANATSNFSYEHDYTTPAAMAGNSELLAKLLRHPTIGPVLQKIAAHDVPIYNRQLRAKRKSDEQ